MVKWGGAVLTAMFLVAIPVSARWGLAWSNGWSRGIKLDAGALHCEWQSPPQSAPPGYFVRSSWSFGSHSQPMQWLPWCYNLWGIQVLILPLWLVGLATGAATAAAWSQDRRARLMTMGSLCPACGYDLAGTITGVCPECGKAAPT